MSIKTITAEQAAQMQKDGAVIVDIRSLDDYTRKHITNAICLPLKTGGINENTLPKNKTIIFTCLSGLTTSNRAAQIQECAGSCEDIYLLDGGTNAWEQAGLPLEKATTGCSLDIMRQVQIAAGSLILLGALLGWLVSPYFFLICAFVGAGLLFAGITGFCGMVHFLNKMPWNKIR